MSDQANPKRVDLDDLESKVRIELDRSGLTLALIARIRELESALLMQCDRLDAFYETFTKVSRDPLNVREILEKGVVLP